MLKILLYMLPCFAFNQLHAQPIESMLPFRGNDSLWVYQRAILSDRFFIGEKLVTRREWLNHLKKGDKEIADLVNKASSFRRRAIWTGAGGSAVMIVGWIGLRNRNTATSYNRNVALSSGLMVVGLASSALSIIYSTKATRNYEQALRLFNYKAGNGALQPITMGIGIGADGLGVQVSW